MSAQTASHNTESAILARLIQAPASMSADVAEYLLSIDFDSADIARMNELAERAREGSLTPEETSELDGYLHVGTLISILQSKARQFMKSGISAPFRQ